MAEPKLCIFYFRTKFCNRKNPRESCQMFAKANGSFQMLPNVRIPLRKLTNRDGSGGYWRKFVIELRSSHKPNLQRYGSVCAEI